MSFDTIVRINRVEIFDSIDNMVPSYSFSSFRKKLLLPLFKVPLFNVEGSTRQ